jgi:hypothetical protein
MKKSKLLVLALLLSGGAMLLQSGCLGAFYQGFTGGWPQSSRVLSIAVDVINARVFGG